MLALIEGTGAVATELTNNVPITAGTIKADLAWPWNLGKSTIADAQQYLENQKQAHNLYNFPDKGNINAGNSIVITDLNAINDISPLPTTPTPKHDIYLLEPVENLDVTSAVECGRDLEGKSNINPIFQEQYRQEAIKNDVKNMLLEKNIPKGSVIIAPIDGELRYFAMKVPNGTVGRVAIDYTDPDGKVEEIGVSGWGDSTNLSLTPLIEGITPYTGDTAVPGEPIFVQVKRGQTIMETLQGGNIVITSTAQLNNLDSTDSWPTNINLLSIPDPKTGVQKTVIVASQ